MRSRHIDFAKLSDVNSTIMPLYAVCRGTVPICKKSNYMYDVNSKPLTEAELNAIMVRARRLRAEFIRDCVLSAIKSVKSLFQRQHKAPLASEL